ncbi:YfcE family phosphodiesterase [Archaeoglobus neptunius]|uniref:YfcE family phosphodiesterase n=1 Tax=Archaeoglobus neptunius TaxID=2798580 RepID=UPI001926B94B|nr:YfcE family phosphodiesterase [Archaeoglobus neptunius]
MKKILAISDTHLKDWNIPERLDEMMNDADMLVHAGDFDSYAVYKKFSDYDLVAVAGDSDDEKIREELPDSAVFEVEGVRFGVVHRGNYINQFHDLIYRAMELNVDVLVFGHLHRFVLEEVRGRVIVCPGSPTSPRLSVASCAEIIVDGSKVDVKFHVVQPLFCGMDTLKALRGGCG